MKPWRGAYLLPVYPEPSYKFSRNGESSVNIQECQFLKTPIDRIFSEYMAKAEMGTKTNYDEALEAILRGRIRTKTEGGNCYFSYTPIQ